MAELRHFSRSYLSAFAQTLDGHHVTIPSHGEWTRQLAQILVHHYARVVRSIETGAMMETTERLDEVVDAERAARLLARAGAQAEMIVNRLETIAGDAMAMMSERKSLQLEEKRQKPRMSVAVIGFFQDSWKKFKSKLRTIANVNTQDVAEEAAAAVRASLPEYLTTGTVVHEWVTVGDDRVRGNPNGRYANSPFDHWSADGQRAELPDGVFTVSGETLRFPGDAHRGASLGNIINCFPADTRVLGDVAGATRHWYDGPLVEITLASGNKLAATPNHPVLTPEGWVAAGSIVKGGHVFSRRNGDAVGRFLGASLAAGTGTFDVDDIEPKIAQVFDALARLGMCVRVGAVDVDFHGDKPAHDVDIVSVDGGLMLARDAKLIQHVDHLEFARTLLAEGLGFADGLTAHLSIPCDRVSAGGVGCDGEGLSFCKRGICHPLEHSIAAASWRQSSPAKTKTYSPPTNAEMVGHGLNRRPALVTLDEVVNIDRNTFSGHVFNLHTAHGLYYANGVIVHNCRCSLRTIWIKPDGTEEVIEDGILNPSSPARRTRRPGENRNRDTRTQPTSSFTFGYGKGPWRGAVILGNGHRANYTVRNGGVTLRVGGKPVASAPIKRDAFGKWTLGNVTTTEPYRDAGIERLLRASVEQSNMLPR